MPKLRSDSNLAHLTEDQRTELFDLLSSHSYREVQEIAAKPEADGGFDLEISKTTLVRFFKQEQKRQHAQELAELAVTEADSKAPNTNISKLIQAAKVEFAHAIYELSLVADEPDNFTNLERALHHVETVDLKREQLLLDRDRLAENKRQFNFNGARAGLNHAAKFGEVLKNNQLDSEEKIWAASEITFGPVPGDGIPTPVAQSMGQKLGHNRTHSYPSPASGGTSVLSPDPSPVENHSSPIAYRPSLEVGHTATHSDPSAPPVPNSGLSTQDSELKKSSVLEPPLFPLPTAISSPNTIGHDNTQSAAPSADSLPIAPCSLLEKDSSLIALHPSLENGHTGTHSSPSRNEATILASREGLSPHTSLLSLTPRQWLSIAKDPDALLRHIAINICNGSADRLEDFLAQTKTFTASRMGNPEVQTQ
jgi:hypothetical protein